MANSSTKSGSTTNSMGGSVSNTQTGSASTSAQQTHSAESYGSHTSTVGGSHTSTQTQGGSTTRTHSEGGAHSESQGKSWASGEVDERTLSKRDQYADYQQDQKVTDTYNRLQETINKRPGAFSSQWDDRLANAFDQLVNGDKFNYDFNRDALYRMYAQQYRKQGQDAAKNVLGQATALTGGYNNSYAQSVAQQTYQNYLQQLNDRIPELQQMAYQRYLTDRSDLKDEFAMAQQLRNNEYNAYRDTVSDWQQDRAFDQSAYQDERNFDRSAYQQDRAYWQQEYWNQRNAEQSSAATSDSRNWNDSISQTDYWENSESQTDYWSDSNTEGWSVGDTSSIGQTFNAGFSNTQGQNWNNQVTNSWSNTLSTPSVGSSMSSAGRTNTLNDLIASMRNTQQPQVDPFDVSYIDDEDPKRIRDELKKLNVIQQRYNELINRRRTQ